MPDAACLQVLNYFNFWDAVPLHGSASFADIAKHTRLPEDVVRRLLKHAISLRIFEESESGKPTSQIRHSFRSAPLARSAGLRALLYTTLDISGPPLMVLAQALERYSVGKESLPKNINETAFALQYSGGQFGKFTNTWDLLENDGEGEKKGWRQREFTVFMDYLKEMFGLEGVVLNSYNWESLGKAKVVDASTLKLSSTSPRKSELMADRLVARQVMTLSISQRTLRISNSLSRTYRKSSPCSTSLYRRT